MKTFILVLFAAICSAQTNANYATSPEGISAIARPAQLSDFTVLTACSARNSVAAFRITVTGEKFRYEAVIPVYSKSETLSCSDQVIPIKQGDITEFVIEELMATTKSTFIPIKSAS